MTAEMGFQFKRGEYHDFAIDESVDIVIIHGPPKGIMDFTASKQRAGCEHLFAAVARARPRLHCFGHIHEVWGAKLITWWGEKVSDNPSHFSEIDNETSVVVESLTSLHPTKWDRGCPKKVKEKKERLEKLNRAGYRWTSHCKDPTTKTLCSRVFVNAAIQSLEEEEDPQLSWIIEMDLPSATAPSPQKRHL